MYDRMTLMHKEDFTTVICKFSKRQTDDYFHLFFKKIGFDIINVKYYFLKKKNQNVVC